PARGARGGGGPTRPGGLRKGGPPRDGDRREPGAWLSRSGQLPRRPHPARPDRGARRPPPRRRAARQHAAPGGRNTNRRGGIKIVSVRRGVHPRQFALVAFGGAAGLHITEVARLLEIRRVVVPSVAAGLSAWGMLATDPRYG